VLATDSPADIVNAAPDCVLYMPRMIDVDDLVALLAAGINVVSTRDELFRDGEGLAPEDRARVLKACVEGNSSAYSTGSSPGFITEVLPYALLSLQRRVDSIAISEYADLSERNSPGLLFEVMGYGKQPSTDSRRANHLLHSFGPSLRNLAEAAGLDVDEWSAFGEVAVTPDGARIVAGELAAGTVAAQRTRLVGTSGGREVITMNLTWYCTKEIEQDWDLGATGWRFVLRGDAPFDVGLPFPVTLEEMGATTPGYTANRPVNVVPWICAAPPGFVHDRDLPAITPVGPRG
jgi:4-hydroxy-tetrahydrodipicolinate reductase